MTPEHRTALDAALRSIHRQVVSRRKAKAREKNARIARLNRERALPMCYVAQNIISSRPRLEDVQAVAAHWAGYAEWLAATNKKRATAGLRRWSY
jgi:hypothetical protein